LGGWLCASIAVARDVDSSTPLEISGSYWYIVDNMQVSEPGSAVQLWVTLPVERPEQKVRVTNITPPPLAISEDPDNGNRIVTWQVAPAADTQTLLFHYDFEIVLTAVTNTVDPDAVQPYLTDSGLYQRFVREEPWLETSDDIAAAAREIMGDEANPYLKARKIYDWLVDEMVFVPGGFGDRSARGTFRSRKGDCLQYSLLFTAFCRAGGIPARTVSCEWLTSGKHVFAEFYLPPYGWLPVDPSVTQMLEGGFPDYLPEEAERFLQNRGVLSEDPDWFFGNLYRNRLIVCVGNNIPATAGSAEENRVFTFMQPGGSSAIPPAILLAGLGDDIIHGGFFAIGTELTSDEAAIDMAHQKLAGAYFDAGFIDVAEAGCLKTLATSPSGAAAWMNLGRVYLRKGQYNKAEASFQRALTGMVVSSEQRLEITLWGRNYLGNCYDLLGRRDLAIGEYEKVLSLNNNYRGAVEYARTYLNRPFNESDF
jgi:transglutaminase-like putative cysteine protease